MIELIRLVSLRHLVAAPLRSLMLMFGIALGVSTVVATTAVNRSILAAFTSVVRDVAGDVDLVITNGDVGVPASVLDEVTAIEGVSHAAGVVEIITQSPDSKAPILLAGLDFLGDQHFMPMKAEVGENVLEDPLVFLNDPQAILVGRSFATELGLKIESQVRLLTPDGVKPFTVRGILDDDGITSTFGGRLVVMYLDAAQLAFARTDRFDRIDVAIADGADASKLQVSLTDVLAGRARAETPQRRVEHLRSMIEPMERGLSLAGIVALLVGMFLIYNAVSIAVVRRRREIGILRAIGTTRSAATAVFCIEALVLATFGAGIGLVMARGLAAGALAQTAPNLSRFYEPIQPPPPEITPDLMVLGLVVGLLTTLIAAYFPARRAAAVDPVESIRREANVRTASEIPIRKLAFAGVMLFGAGLVMSMFETAATANGAIFTLLGGALLLVPAFVSGLRRLLLAPTTRLLGIPGRLALDNAERSLERSATTVAALMMAVSTSVCVGGWGKSLEHAMFTWLDQTLPADIYVSSGSPVDDQLNVPFRAAVVDKLAGTTGVSSLYGARTIDVDIGDKRVRLLSIDTAIYYDELAQKSYRQHVFAGPDPIDGRALSTAPLIILADNAARRLGLTAGDELEFSTPSGRRKFGVHAVVADYTSDLGTAIIDRKWFVEAWQDELVDTVAVFTDDGVDLASVATEVRARLGNDGALFVVTSANLRDEIRKMLVEFLQVFRSTDLIALMVALLGVVGTMLTVVIDRVREIALLRAIGATKRQIATSITAEAGFLGLAAAVGGAITGIPMGWVFVRVLGVVSTGWKVDYVFPAAEAAGVGVAVLIIAMAAGLVVGRQAARIQPIEALEVE